MKNKIHFTESDIKIKGHPLGYITDGNIPESDPRSVRDCNNMDFDNFDKRRDPYMEYSDLSSILPAGYDISNFFIKEFINKDNTSTEVIIVFATKAANPSKVYVNKSYNPGNNYGNGLNSTGGWITGWQEITETYSLALTGAISTATGTSTITAPKTIATDYFRGWFIYDGTTCVGFVTKSTSAASGASCTLTIRINPYYNGTTVALRAIVSLSTYTLSRFPVNVQNNITELTEVSFSESYNTVRIACGPENRIYWLGFITDRNFFNQTTPVGSGDNRYYTAWWGFWFDFDVPLIANKKVYKRHYSTVNAEVAHYIQDDIIELGAILKYNIYTSVTPDEDHVTVVSCAITMDGYQGIFLKNLMIDRTAAAHASNFAMFKSIQMIWTLEFNRRLTDLNLFYARNDKFVSINTTSEDSINEIFQTYQMEPFSGGNINFTDKPRNSGEYDFSLNAYTTIYIDGSLIYYAYNWNSVNGYDYANGQSLNQYLNMQYWDDITMKTKQIIKVENLNIAISIKNKLNQIGLSNIMNGDVETESIYGTERYFQATSGDELIGGAASQENQFILFTKKECIVAEIFDKVKSGIAVTGRYAGFGALNMKAIVAARVKGELQAVSLAGQNSIYLLANNQPMDILEGKWREEYRALSDNIKAAIVGGYYRARREIFYVINGKEYIFNMDKLHWKKYTYEDVPLTLYPEKYGEMLWHDTDKIYKTEPTGTAQWMDKGTDGIDFFYKQALNNGTAGYHKILKKIDISTMSIVKDDNNVDTVIYIKAGKNSLTDPNILNYEFYIVADQATINKLTKKRSNYYYFQLGNTITGADNIKTIRFNEIILRSKLVRRKLQKI